MRYLISIILVFGFLLQTTLAQDAVTCDATQILEEASSAFASAQQAWESGEIEQMLSDFREIEELSAALHVACNGQTYTSEEYGVNAVIKDFSLVAGTYIVRLDGAMTLLKTTTLEGECGPYDLGLTAYADRDSGYAETVFETTDCKALLEIDGDESWTLTIEKIK